MFVVLTGRNSVTSVLDNWDLGLDLSWLSCFCVSALVWLPCCGFWFFGVLHLSLFCAPYAGAAYPVNSVIGYLFPTFL